jgi:hypothetical protein
MATPNRVKMLAKRMGFDVAPASGLLGTETSGWYVIRASKTAAPVEVYFRRASGESAWLWSWACHRVHWSDPIAKNNGGQPELATFTAWRAYMSLLATVIA